MFAVIGDVVGSRRLADRRRAQRLLAQTLDEVSGEVEPMQRLEPTVGDEFQGAFATVGGASLAGLLVRLTLLPEVDVRVGIGEGTTTVYDDERTPRLQDGPAWWAAREALSVMAAPRRTGLRSWYLGPDAALVNAHLLCRDALVDRLHDRGCRMLRLALLGQPQRRIAEVEGISRSAVSQQFARGIGAVREAQRLLEEVG